MRKNIVIIGSTGSIGKQTLDVVRHHPGQFKVTGLASYENIELLEEQVHEFKPSLVAVHNKEAAQKLRTKLAVGPGKNPEIFDGNKGWQKIASHPSSQKIVFASSGLTALSALMKAIGKKKEIALANKEMIVAAGKLIMTLAKKKNVTIVPIDSEHSAIFQCLQGEDPRSIEKVILTCSGGPFYGKKKRDLENITVKDALNHPTWKMGNKITVDCATLINKGLEMIEAKHFFGLREDQIEIIIHPESIIHSFVQFKDGSVKAQASYPDMRIAITYALAYPRRIQTSWPRVKPALFRSLTFLPPDLETFEGPELARKAAKKGGNLPAVLTHANDLSVEQFLAKKITFPQIYRNIKRAVQKTKFIKNPSLEYYQELSISKEIRS